MPIYEYECNACHTHLEVTQSIKDAPLKTCESCGKDELQKLISRSAFHLKGGGWYSDLYSSSSGKKEEAKTEKKESTSTTSSSDTGSSTASAPAAAPAASSSGSSEKKAEARSAAA